VVLESALCGGCRGVGRGVGASRLRRGYGGQGSVEAWSILGRRGYARDKSEIEVGTLQIAGPPNSQFSVFNFQSAGPDVARVWSPPAWAAVCGGGRRPDRARKVLGT